ncbi:DUF5348 domain-containing protein [Paenibacillus kribbensis]|uniref:DUF5348 domain-containing protein n=1 Tax=Paenibacillus kribbensis TaxID=172713 RepID=UPI002DBCA279|nr:DUF5348 domain-containing protein [Paenibacillus kribbensis]MEC0238242.1 DUF5348 domain-containing protein [Paenibacillus kribbensis]
MKKRMLKEFGALEESLKWITKDLKKMEDSWTDFFNAGDPQDMYLRRTFGGLEDKLSDVRRKLQGIHAEIVAEGTLRHNKDGRYEIEGTDYYFTSGSSIEVLHSFYEDEPLEWIESTVEHDGADYYLTRLKGVSMNGLTARAKRYPLWDY